MVITIKSVIVVRWFWFLWLFSDCGSCTPGLAFIVRKIRVRIFCKTEKEIIVDKVIILRSYHNGDNNMKTLKMKIVVVVRRFWFCGGLVLLNSWIVLIVRRIRVRIFCKTQGKALVNKIIIVRLWYKM